MTEIWAMTAEAMSTAFGSGELSPPEALEAVLARVEAINPAINAVFWQRADAARAEAEAAAARWREGAPRSPIDGIPITIKDSIAMEGTPYWRGHAANKGKMSSRTSPPAARLQEAGAVIFGKTTMPDSGMLGAGVSSAHGVTRNPWNLACNTGGSSAGAAAGLAAGFGPISVGTDMAGSVRAPSAICGGVGFKPTQGRVPHLPPSTVRSAGPMARNVRDAAELLTILSGADWRDYGSLAPVDFRYEDRLTLPETGRPLRIGLALEAGYGLPTDPVVAAEIARVAKLLEAEGAEIVPLDSLVERDPMEALGRLFALRTQLEVEAMSPDERKLLPDYAVRLCAESACSAIDYATALDELEAWKAWVVAASQPYDFLLTPAIPVTSFPAEAAGADPDSNLGHLNFMAPFNQTGQPGVTLPSALAPEGTPISVQIVGQRFDDAPVLALAAKLEAILGFGDGLAPITA